jgi:hypothetical protein
MKRAALAAVFLWAIALILRPQAHAEDPALADSKKLRELLAVHLADLEGAAIQTSGGGLKLTAILVPDALAYQVAKEYLKRRELGEDHQAALKGAAPLLTSSRQREGMAAVLLKIENQTPRPGGLSVSNLARRRVYTLEKPFAGDAVTLLQKGKPVPVRLAEPPRNLRSAQIRVKKFWTTDNARGRQGFYDPDDAASVGRKPLLSKPSAALLIEEKPVEAELLWKAKLNGSAALPRLVLSGLKRFEGPFENDQLDLNGGRQWEPVEPLEVSFRPPPGGLEPSRALQKLMDEVKAVSTASGK